MLTETLVPSPRGVLDDAELLSPEEVDRATYVAEWAVPGGRILDIDRARPWTGAALAVEIEDFAGVRWAVLLLDDFRVLEVVRR